MKLKANTLRNKTGTQTSSYGTTGRINHDASKFYTSKLYQELNPQNQQSKRDNVGYKENLIPKASLNKVFCKSSEKLAEVPDASVHLMVTSPPYNVGKAYDEDLSLAEYRALLRQVFLETYRVLVPGGRACINVANVGRKPYIPLHGYIIEDMRKLGYLMRGEIIWDKGASASSSTAWGSWLKANNPVLRDTHEYILIFSKSSYSLSNQSQKISTIAREEFLEFTKSVWSFHAERANQVGHPAPFPIELPYRLIQLYTFKGDVVLDPFAGAGTTCLASLKTGRNFIAYDIEKAYCDLANKRIDQFQTQLKQRMLGFAK
ncbi:DNA methylase [Spirochaetota bacterium]|nr:DNA methylase [Spirochaetota bacterium]